MRATAVVPDQQVARRPGVAILEGRVGDVGVDLVEQSAAVRAVQPGDQRRGIDIGEDAPGADEQELAAGASSPISIPRR